MRHSACGVGQNDAPVEPLVSAEADLAVVGVEFTLPLDGKAAHASDQVRARPVAEHHRLRPRRRCRHVRVRVHRVAEKPFRLPCLDAG